jgi:hypothetical protein
MCYLKDGEVVTRQETGGNDTDGYPVFETVKTGYRKGALALLMSAQNINRENSTRFYLLLGEEGAVGIPNHNIRRYHGDRGTDCDILRVAHGQRKITGIRQLKNGQVAITVGADLHPEWE